MTKAAALELAPRRIRVNSIHPGEIDTPMIADLGGSDVVPSFDQIPLGRYGRAEEVAALAVFLLSDDAGYTTGAEHIIDGGYTAR
jgi:3alpha(or 20beta)-hydroxysteroid dehydrogenase